MRVKTSLLDIPCQLDGREYAAGWAGRGPRSVSPGKSPHSGAAGKACNAAIGNPPWRRFCRGGPVCPPDRPGAGTKTGEHAVRHICVTLRKPQTLPPSFRRKPESILTFHWAGHHNLVVARRLDAESREFAFRFCVRFWSSPPGSKDVRTKRPKAKAKMDSGFRRNDEQMPLRLIGKGAPSIRGFAATQDEVLWPPAQ